MPINTPSKGKTPKKADNVAEQKEEVETNKVAQKEVTTPKALKPLSKTNETPKVTPIKKETPKIKAKPQAPPKIVDSDSDSESEEDEKTAVVKEQPKKKIETPKAAPTKAKAAPAKAKSTPIKKEIPKIVESDDSEEDSEEDAHAMQVESSKKRTAPESNNAPVKQQKTEQNQNPTSHTIEAKKSIYIKGFGDTDPDSIKDLFSRFGEIVDFKVSKDFSSSKTKSVIIEFSTVEEAQSALTQDGTEIKGKTYTLSVTPSKSRTAAQTAEAEKRVLFIGGLSFETTSDTLTQQLNELDVFPSEIRLAVHADSNQCRGFGYIEFATPEEAQAACEKLDGLDLNGRNLRVEVSGGPRQPREKQPAKTLFVGSLNFKSTAETVKEAFIGFGCTPENVRIIQNEDGRSKGFAYVEFSTPEEAQEAIQYNGHEIDGRSVKLDFAGDKQRSGGVRGGRGAFRGGRGGRGGRGARGGRGRN